MAHQRFTAEETANLIMNDQVDDLFGTSIAAIESDVTDDDDVDPYQPVLPDSDSDEDFTPDLDDDLCNDNGDDDEAEEDSDVEEDNPDNFFYSKDKSVKWTKRAPGQQGHADAAKVGPTPIVPQHIQSPMEAFTLTFPNELVENVIKQNPCG